MMRALRRTFPLRRQRFCWLCIHLIACKRGKSLIHGWHPGGATMAEMILLSQAQMARILPLFPLAHGIPQQDDRRVISGIIFLIRIGLK